MNDEDLLDYFEIHSRTERALFHRDMVVRLFELADEDLSGLGLPKWHTMRSDYSDPLVKRARERMDVNTARYILIAGFVPDGVARSTAIHQSIAALAQYAYEENQRMRQELEGFRRNGRILRTLITLVRGIPSVVALLKKLEETEGSIPSCDWGPADDDTVERRAETLLKTIDGTYPTRELTREELGAL